MSRTKNLIVYLLLVVLLCVVPIANNASSQDKSGEFHRLVQTVQDILAKKFATKGSTELGGSISFQSLTPVSNGNTGDATSIFSLEPFIGYFVADGFEIGLNPLGITSARFSGSSSTQVMIFAAPSYNFRTEGIAYPFIEALLGFTSQSDGSSRSGFSWGGRGGVKLAVTDKGLLNLGVQYIQITQNPSGAANRYGSNQLTISAGFTVWF